MADRRDFLKRTAALAGFAAATRALPQMTATSVAPVPNKSPLAPSALVPLRLGSIKPKGWLRDQLLIQATGLTGHLEEVWPDVGANSGWLGGTGESWERGPYYLDGLVPLAYLLDDAALKQKAQKWIEWTLTHQQANGMIGPKSNDDWWPRMVMLKVLAQYQEATGDVRVIPVMQKYCEYQLRELQKRPLRDWGKYRWHDNAVPVLWLYNRTDDPRLLDLAHLLRKQGQDWRAEFAHFEFTSKTDKQSLNLNDSTKDNTRAMRSHGVNNAMGLKHSPVVYQLTRDARDREALWEQLALLDRYHGLPNGMFSCDEHFAGKDPSQGSELCSVVESMYSLELAIAMLGRAELADRLETLAFNALPGTLTDDMWAHQYDQQPNQIRADVHERQWSTNGPDSNVFGLEPNFGCCTANYHQGWPKYAASLWMATPDDGLAGISYAPCSVETVAGGVPVALSVETEYPFRETVAVEVIPRHRARFPLLLRVPGWCERASVMVNGSSVELDARDGFVRLVREWSRGDHVRLQLPMKVRAIRESGGVSFQRGPVVFSYPVAAKWAKIKDRRAASDWSAEPTSAWNYGLRAGTAKALEVSASDATGAFTERGARVVVEVEGERVAEWREEQFSAGPVPTSAKGDRNRQTLRLVPYAAAKLRVTAFPELT